MFQCDSDFQADLISFSKKINRITPYLVIEKSNREKALPDLLPLALASRLVYSAVSQSSW